MFQVLHYLAMQKPADLTYHLLPCILHAALLKLKEEGKSSSFKDEIIMCVFFSKIK